MMGHPDAGRFVSRRWLIGERLFYFALGAASQGIVIAVALFLAGRA